MPRFGLLGTVLVEDDGTAITIEATKPRVVLAALLLHANQTVSVERLIDALWDDRPPASAKVTVQGHINRLLQALGPHLAVRLRTTTAGYVMQVHDGELDCEVMATLYERARREATAGDMHAAAATLAVAQRLWPSGTPRSSSSTSVSSSRWATTRRSWRSFVGWSPGTP